jgi:hypothetical protein
LKPVDLVAVFVRLFAAYLVLGDLSLAMQMAQTIGSWSASSRDLTPILVASAVAVLGVFVWAVLFWLFPIRIARFIVPREVDSDLAIGFSAEQLEVCLLSLLGVYVLIYAVPQAVWILIRIATVEMSAEDPMQRRADLVYSSVRIALGAFLLLRSVGIRRVVHDLRTKGTLSRGWSRPS